MSRLDKADFLGGLFVFLVGAAFFYDSQSYEIGTLTRMGPGFLPVTVGAVTAALGIVIAVSAFGRSGDVPGVEIRAALAVLVAIAVFGFLLERAGLVPAALCTVVVAALGDRSARLLSTLVLALTVALGTWLVFAVALGLPMRAFEVQ